MLEEISEDQTDWLSPPATPRNRTTVETPPGDAATSPQMPAANAPDAGNHSQPAEEAPESESPLTSLSTSPPPSPPPQYLDPIMPASPRSKAGYCYRLQALYMFPIYTFPTNSYHTFLNPLPYIPHLVHVPLFKSS